MKKLREGRGYCIYNVARRIQREAVSSLKIRGFVEITITEKNETEMKTKAKQKRAS